MGALRRADARTRPANCGAWAQLDAATRMARCCALGFAGLSSVSVAFADGLLVALLRYGCPATIEVEDEAGR